jgi:ribosomal protein S18 acetylase RimI-like enzyme
LIIITVTKNCVKDKDQDFLFEMLYQSIYHAPGTPEPDRRIIEAPEIAKYVENWGKKGDYALIAVDGEGHKLGALWLRYFDFHNKGYGYISDEIPEIGIAVDAPHRGKGIGSFLLQELLERTKKSISSISLSVQPENPAMRLYLKFGFYECGRSDGSVIMRYDFY